MAMLQTLVVESDPDVRKVLVEWMSRSRQLAFGGIAYGVGHARMLLRRTCPQVVLCSAELVDGSGFDVLELLPANSQVVVLANCAAHALQAFDVDARDCLIKPIGDEQLRLMEERLVVEHRRPRPSTVRTDRSVMVEVGRGQQFVDAGEIVAIVSIGGNYTEVHRVTGPALETRRSIKSWQQLLPHDRFVRTHRSTLVNVHYVGDLHCTRSGNGSLRVRNQATEFPVSRRLAATLTDVVRIAGP
jgi:DNA-binding LytR/AlgR family response regulator